MADNVIKLEGYKRLIAWQKADEYAKLIYQITQDFPKSEVFALTSQLRRSGLSIPTNIVEGYARNSKKELHRFLAISLGSLAETQYLLEFSLNLKYIKQRDFDEIFLLKEELGKIIWSLYKSLI